MIDIAKALDVPVAHLWALWQGRKIEPDSVEEALRQHTEAIAAQTRLMGDLVSFVRSAAVAITAAGGADRQIRDAHVAVGAAQEDSAAEPGGAQPSEPGASAQPRRPDEETPRR